MHDPIQPAITTNPRRDLITHNPLNDKATLDDIPTAFNRSGFPSMA